METHKQAELKSETHQRGVGRPCNWGSVHRPRMILNVKGINSITKEIMERDKREGGVPGVKLKDDDSQR